MLSRGSGRRACVGAEAVGITAEWLRADSGGERTPHLPHGTTRYRRPDSALIPAHSPTPGLEPAASSVAPPPRDGTGGGGARWAGP